MSDQLSKGSAGKRGAKARAKNEQRVDRATPPSQNESQIALKQQQSQSSQSKQQQSNSDVIFDVTYHKQNTLRSRISQGQNSGNSSIQGIGAGIIENTFLMGRKSTQALARTQNQVVQATKTPQKDSDEVIKNPVDQTKKSNSGMMRNTHHGQNHLTGGQGDEAPANVGGQPEEGKQQPGNRFAKLINLYVQLPNETMSELIRDYTAHFFDKSEFSKKAGDGDGEIRADDELNLTLNPTSLLEPNMVIKKPFKDHQVHPKSKKHDSILSSNRSATADFLNLPVSKSPYAPAVAGSVKSGISNKLGASLSKQNTTSSNDKQDLLFKLTDVMAFLKRQGYPIEGTNVSYYSGIFSAFVNCNIDPVGDFVHISEKDLELIDNTQSLRLRFEKGLQDMYRDGDEDTSEREDEDNSFKESRDNEGSRCFKTYQGYGSRSRTNNGQDGTKSEQAHYSGNPYMEKPKTKERTVAYVIQKVTQWRRLYNGYYDKDFNHQRLSLEDAADQVGVSKKSLDDYLSQLRSGRQCGYNFNAFKNEKVGHLRKFVKDHMDQLANQGNLGQK